MTNFNIYNELDAPASSKETLEKIKKGTGLSLICYRPRILKQRFHVRLNN
jgi:hypothetical protein